MNQKVKKSLFIIAGLLMFMSSQWTWAENPYQGDVIFLKQAFGLWSDPLMHSSSGGFAIQCGTTTDQTHPHYCTFPLPQTTLSYTFYQAGVSNPITGTINTAGEFDSSASCRTAYFSENDYDNCQRFQGFCSSSFLICRANHPSPSMVECEFIPQVTTPSDSFKPCAPKNSSSQVDYLYKIDLTQIDSALDAYKCIATQNSDNSVKCCQLTSDCAS